MLPVAAWRSLAGAHWHHKKTAHWCHTRYQLAVYNRAWFDYR